MGLWDTLKATGVDTLKQGSDKIYSQAVEAAGVGTKAAGVPVSVTQTQAVSPTSQNGTAASPVSSMSFLSHPKDLLAKAQANPVLAIIAVLIVGGGIWYAYRKFA